MPEGGQGASSRYDVSRAPGASSSPSPPLRPCATAPGTPWPASAPARIPGQRAGGQPEAAPRAVSLRRVHGNPRLVALPPEFSLPYTNKFVNEEPFSWPAQWSLGTSQVDACQTANWGLDGLRLVWMTVIFCALFPLSRSIRMLATNYSPRMAPRRRRPGVLLVYPGGGGRPTRMALEHARRAVVRRRPRRGLRGTGPARDVERFSSTTPTRCSCGNAAPSTAGRGCRHLLDEIGARADCARVQYAPFDGLDAPTLDGSLTVEPRPSTTTSGRGTNSASTTPSRRRAGRSNWRATFRVECICRRRRRSA